MIAQPQRASGTPEEQVHWLRRELESLRDSVRLLQARASAEDELIRTVRGGADTIPAIVRALRARAAELAGRRYQPGPHLIAGVERDQYLARELTELASAVEAEGRKDGG